MYVGQRGYGDTGHLWWDDEHGHHDAGCGRLSEYGKSVRADGRHARQNTRDIRRSDGGRLHLGGYDARAHSVFGGNAEMGNGGLAESMHATSGHRSDVLHHAAHHCGDDDNALRDDGAASHGYGDAAFRGGDDVVLCGLRGHRAYGRSMNERAPAHSKHVAGCAVRDF